MTFPELVGAYLKACKLFWVSSDIDIPEGSFLMPAAAAAGLRQYGVPVEAYHLVQPKTLGFAHLCWTNRGWDIHLPPFHCLTSSPEAALVGEPPTGTWFVVLPYPEETGKELTAPDVLVVYASTQDAADVDPQVFSELVGYFEVARNSGRPVIYVDALGLIPEETVRGSSTHEESAFRSVYEALSREIGGIGQGLVPCETGSPFWRELYCFLAKHHIPSVLENLTYELWREIVDFDHKHLLNRAMVEFTTGFPEEAAQTMALYARQFHELNCLRRAASLADQVRELLNVSPRPLVLLVREIGHYGVLERLLSRDYVVHSKILGLERFRHLFAAPGVAEGFLINLEVHLPEEVWRILGLHSCLRFFLLPCLKTKSFRDIVRYFAKSRLEDLGFRDVQNLFEQLDEPMAVYQRSQGYSLHEQAFALLRAQGVLPEEEAGHAAQ
ncbi:MAG: hypothetical protein QXP01_03805 [Candidatus Hadarchaeum sp.]